MSKTIQTQIATTAAAPTKVAAPKVIRKSAPRVLKAVAAKPMGLIAAILKDAPKVAPVAEAPKVVAPKVAPFVQPITKTGGLKITHAIRDGYRPDAGARLYAHTAVFLAYSGIDKTPMPTATVRTIIGDTAVNYHMRRGNLATVQDTRDKEGKLTQRGGIVLTPTGAGVFGKRQPNPEFFSAFENILCRGEVDERGLKNPEGLVQIA